MARLRESESRDDTSHASAIVDQQLAEADDDLRDTLEARHSQPTEWVCPECGEQRRTHTGDDPEGSCFTCGDDETDWQRVVSDGGRPICTDPTCTDTAEYAYWMPDMGDFCRVRAPEKPELEDGDLCPYVCESCRDWRISNGRYEAERFVDPREKLVTDGGENPEPPATADEWSTDCSNPQWSDNCNGDLETERERKKGLCEGCMAVIRSWSDRDDDDSTDETEQTTLMTDGGQPTDTQQARLDVGDTRKPAVIKDARRVTTGDLAALSMCAHRYDPADVWGWYTHEFDDVLRQWICSNVGSVIARLSPHCEYTRGDLPPLHPSDDLWVGESDTGPTQARLVTDGGGNLFLWDDADCPHDDCAGPLQHQDWHNVLCLECDDVFMHMYTEDEHWLVTSDFEKVAQKSNTEGNGGAATEEACQCTTGRMQSGTPDEWRQLGTKAKVADRVVLALLKDLNAVPKTVWTDEFSKATDGMSQLRSTLENRLFEEHICDIADTDVFYGTANIEEATIRLDKSGIYVEEISYDRTQKRNETEADQ